MIPYEAYKLVHYFGIFSLMIALGGLSLHAINGGDKSTNSARKLVAITHGVALFLVLLGGFGMLARLGLTNGIPAWIWIKLALWLLLGALLVIPYRLPKLTRPLWFLLPFVGLAAAAVALYKPFT
jgi:hypothetical protein